MVVGIGWEWNQATLVLGMEKAEMQESGKLAWETAQGWRRVGEGKGLGRIDEDRESGKKRFLLNFVGKSEGREQRETSKK